MEHYEQIRELIVRVRRRWLTLKAFRAATLAALASSVAISLALVAARWTYGSPIGLIAIATLGLAAAGVGFAWALVSLRGRPGDRQVARFIEEREPTLEDRLVSAVDVALQNQAAPERGPGLAAPMLADAVRLARGIEIDAILPSRAVRRAGFQAVAAAVLLAVAMFSGRPTAQQAYDAARLTLFPARVAIEVLPGNARIRAGSTLTVQARLVGNSAPVLAQVQTVEDDGHGTDAKQMKMVKPGEFQLSMESVSASFRYRVVAGAVASPVFRIVAVRPPRVARIDVDYTYPAALGLPARTERDGGDVYAPAGSDVRLHVVTDPPAATGSLSLGDGRTLELAQERPSEFTAALKVVDDNSYRIALADREGLSSAGDTEYFIRVLEDTPPDVRVIKPATDRSVTRLEEVDIEAQAEDDYAIASLDFVYSIRGGPDHAVPLAIPSRQKTVTGRHTLFLEDLDVQPGDFVSYFVRARDLTRGTRPHEARSDIFFLEVRPYEQEFALAKSQASAAAGGGRSSIDDLVAAQKDIIVATWKLDRRAVAAKGAKSEEDIRAVSHAEAELKSRAQQASSTFRESTLRDPRRRPQRGGRNGGGATPELKAGQTLPEEDEMSLAGEAMGKAVASLDALKTGDARAPEMDALNHLIKAQADVKKREVTRQQAGSGAGNNRSNYDLSTLFDRELQKQQETNYETKSSAEQKDDAGRNALDKVRELARRQDELLKRQQELARAADRMSEDELRRQLENLTREQSELRQRAEDLLRQMAQERSASAPERQPRQQNGRAGEAGQQTSSGQPGADASGRPGGNQTGQQLRDAWEAMRSATNDLRRQDPKQASASGGRALDKLRELERQMQSTEPDEQRRALGEMQLEARQIADGERQVASELARTAPGDAARDAVRRLAGDEQRLAERARALEESLRRQGAEGHARAKPSDADARAQKAAAEASQELQRQRLAERMQQSASRMRAAADSGPGAQRGDHAAAPATPAAAKGETGAQQDLARAFDQLADRLATALGAKDGESQKLSDQISRAQQLRDRIDSLTAQMTQLSAPNGRNGQNPSGPRGSGQGSTQGSVKAPGESGRTGQGEQGGGGGSGTEIARLRDEYQRALRETRDLMEQIHRDDPSSPTFARGGAGFTFEGRGMTLSAPGTEAFKQDFSKWDDLRRQATQALEAVQGSLSKKLQSQQAKDRLAAGAADGAPPGYRTEVAEYFKAIAKKRGGGQ